MKKPKLLLLLIAMVGLFWTSRSIASVQDTTDLIEQDSINARSLIISEMMMSTRTSYSWSYVEFANTGETMLDLSHYFTWSTYQENVWDAENGVGSKRRVDLQGELAPGETYIIVKRAGNSWEKDPWGNLLYPNGYGNMEAEAVADLIRTRQDNVEDETLFGETSFWNEYRIGLAYINQITEYQDSIFPDSVFIDRFGISKEDTEGGIFLENEYRFPIAGVPAEHPSTARVYVRKYGVIKGNTVEGVPNDYPTVEWDGSRGTDLSDSEWIPLPRTMEGGFDKVFTTMGYHGTNPAFNVSLGSTVIDATDETITIPYGTSRDSVFRLFETGINHAWELKLGEDTAQFFVQSDDSLIFYTVGETLKTYKFGVELSGSKASSALVAPLVYKNVNGVFVRNYDISNGITPMDTIGTLPYDLPVDTFFKYMVKEEGATWNIIPADGINRPEIKDGDILEVSSKDNSTTKEYYLGVNTFFPNQNANLSSIIISGQEVFENPETFLFTDTLIGFSSANTLYSVTLPSDVVSCPAIIATPESSLANVTVKRATDLRGSEEARTARIVVTAEDDTIIKEYKIIFSVEREQPDIKGSLIITDVAVGWQASNVANVQLFNPSSEDLDLSDYGIVVMTGNSGWGNVENALAPENTWETHNQFIFRFGSKIEPSDNGTPVFTTDLIQDKLILESQEEYNLCDNAAYPITNAGTNPDMKALADAHVNLIFNRKDLDWKNWSTNKGWLIYAPERYGSIDPYGTGALLLKGFNPKITNYSKTYAHRFALVKIINDSVKDGTKIAFSVDNFDTDYEWVDVFGGLNFNTLTAQLADNDEIISLITNVAGRNGVYRKPHIYKGNPVDGLSFGIALEDSTTVYASEWIPYGWDPATGTQITSNDEGTGVYDVRDARFGAHSMITYAHIPYLTSSVYLIEEGLVGIQDIAGVTSGTSVNAFLNNVDKADTNMVIKLYDAEGDEISNEDLIGAGSKVWSWSANGFDSVAYIINTIGSLNSDCNLTSTEYTVSSTGATGIVSGITMGTSIAHILEKVSAPANAILQVTDGMEANLPVYKYNADTVSQQNLDKIAILASPKTFLEVTAQDKVTKCLYALQFNEEPSPFVLSDVFVVNEDEKTINFVWRTSPQNFLSKLIASTGASMKVVNKYDQERTIGMLEYSDRVIVSIGDISTQYWLNFSVNEDVIGLSNNKIESKQLSISPNPTTDFVQLKGLSGKFIEVRDLTGKLISKQNLTTSDSILDMRHFNTGIYIISTENASYKIIKE